MASPPLGGKGASASGSASQQAQQQQQPNLPAAKPQIPGIIIDKQTSSIQKQVFFVGKM